MTDTFREWEHKDNHLYGKQAMLFCASADKLLGNCTNENHHVFKADSLKYFDYILETSAFNAEGPKARLFYHPKKSILTLMLHITIIILTRGKQKEEPRILCNNTSLIIFFTDNFSSIYC